MPDAGPIDVVVADWAAHAATLAAIRREVFVLEQGVPEDVEWDGLDPDCVHVLALANRDPVGTGRLAPTGKIGRLAVRAASRRHGVGSLMLRRLVELARERGLAGVYLHAQVPALGFYAAHGFVAEGPEFDEAGIAHRRMRLELAAVEPPAVAPRRETDAAGHAR